MGNRQAAVDMVNAAVTAANDRSQTGHLDRAYHLFCSATIADPTFATALHQMACANADMQRHEAAVAAWRRALECQMPDDERARILTNLGWFLHVIGKNDEAVEHLAHALKIAPTAAPAWCNMSVVQGIRDQQRNSVACAAKAFELDPTNVQHEIALAFACLFDRQFARGLKHFEKRFEWRLHQYLHSPYPQWQGESGGTLYLMSDQGLGDTLSFARFVEKAAERCSYIHASVHPELLRLFSHSFLHIKNINLIPQPGPYPQADYWSTFVSLPAALGLTDAEFINQPHISTPLKSKDGTNQFGIPISALPPPSWKVPDRKLHIGIAWKGNTRSDIDKHRSIPLQQFLELYRVPGIQLYSLQVDAASDDLYQQGCTALVRDLKPYINDVTDTLALIGALDMVICLESAVGHIAGLADKETWIPYSYGGRDYRAGLRGDDPIWYPKHRFFRQEKDETWQPVFERINQALREKLTGM